VLTLDNRILDYNTICEKIKIDKKIRFAGVINERGKLVAGGMKEGIEPLESAKDDDMIFMELALRVKMRKEFDRQLGPVNFATALREKGLAMSFPIKHDDILYVFAEPDSNYAKLPSKIIKIIQE